MKFAFETELGPDAGHLIACARHAWKIQSSTFEITKATLLPDVVVSPDIPCDMCALDKVLFSAVRDLEVERLRAAL